MTIAVLYNGVLSHKSFFQKKNIFIVSELLTNFLYYYFFENASEFVKNSLTTKIGFFSEIKTDDTTSATIPYLSPKQPRPNQVFHL